MTSLTQILSLKKTFNILLILNFAISLLIFYFYRTQNGGDLATYLGLAEGLTHHKYSYWWFLPEYIPDTFRSPGYPLFLYVLKIICNSLMFILIVQLVLYFISIWLTIKIISNYNDGYTIKNLFLFLLLPSIQFPRYATFILPEMLMLFLITIFIYIDKKMDNSKWLKYILLGFLFGYMFQVRPVIFFLPFIISAAKLFIEKKDFHFKKHTALIILYLLTTLPYGMWNYKNHRVFKIMPLESGAGVAYIGYWAPKIPGYRETRYWGNLASEEMVSFVNKNEINSNILTFNKEWDYIDSVCANYITDKDQIMLQAWQNHPELFRTYSSRYTIEREKLLREILINNIKKDIWFVTKTKIYAAIRFWVTGVNLNELRGSKTVADKITAIYPFFLTGVTFLLAVISIPYAVIRKRIKFSSISSIIITLIYFGLIYIPFAIQARYTLPVRMLLLFLISYALTELFLKKKVIMFQRILDKS